MSGSEKADGAALNLKQVAARLGLHYMTVYRYVRQGRLEAERSGTEWRVTPAALERFTSGGPAGGRADWADRLERCLLAGDEVAAWQVLESALAAAQPPASCYVDVVCAALASIGARGEAGELDLAAQYVATAVATRVVARLGARFRRPGRSRGRLVFGAPVGERHSLPIAIAADLVRLEGFDVLELGADVPAEVFAIAAGRTDRLVAVGIGVTSDERLGEVQATVDAVHGALPDVPIVVGGYAAAEPIADRVRGVDAWSADGREVGAVVARLAAMRMSGSRGDV